MIQDDKRRRRLMLLATLPVLVPATTPLLRTHLHGAIAGLPADLWIGVAMGMAIGLQLVGVALLARVRGC